MFTFVGQPCEHNADVCCCLALQLLLAGCQEYLAGRERLKQLPLATNDDDIVQCAAYLLQQIQEAGAAGSRVVLLCSGDNNVVGGKVRRGRGGGAWVGG
jgi:hypothetical protein